MPNIAVLPVDLVALIGAISALIIGWRGKTAAQQAARQVSPNHGSSLADAIRRVETSQKEMARDIGGIRADLRGERAERLAEQRQAHITTADIHTRLTRLENEERRNR